MRCFIGLALITIALLPTAHAAPLEAYARLPLYENVALSPDGTKAAFVTTVGDEREIVIQPLGVVTDGKDILRIKSGPHKLRGLRWAGANHLLINSSSSIDFIVGSQSELFSTFVYDLVRKESFNPWQFPDTHTGAWLATSLKPLPEGKATTFLYGGSGIYRFDLDKQTRTLLDAVMPSDNFVWYSWMLDASRSPAMRTTYDEKTKKWSLSLLKNRQWIDILNEPIPIDTPQIVGVGTEANTAIIQRIENGEAVARYFSLAEGTWGELLPSKWNGSSYVLDQRTGRIVAAVQLGARRRYVFLDDKLQASWEQIEQSLPGEEIELESWSDDWQKLVVRTFGKQTGAGYILVDLTTKQLSRIANFYAGVEAADIAPVRAINYTATDGLQIGAYLTVPNGKPTQNLPLVVLPHGGPAARDVLKFDWLAQALASKGYLVLQPNFRGSWGLDLKFQEAGYGEWGRKMQTDLSDGVRALTKAGIVDAARVCIVGLSYGGYAALHGATSEVDTYRCAISVAGISDLKEQFKEYIGYGVLPENRAVRYSLRYLGAAKLSDPILTERSPAKHADKVKAPILLIHGDNDSVVPFEQSQIMANALKKAGKQYEFVKLKSEDHWLSKADTRLQTLQSVVKFLETHNPP